MELVERKLPSKPGALRVINGQLWCCCGAEGIVLLDADLKHLRTVPSKDNPVNDVTETQSGDLVVATQSGLYHCNSYGWSCEFYAYLYFHS